MAGSEFGKVVEITRFDAGSETIQDHLINDTILYLSDTSDFDESGGQLSIEGEIYNYISRDDDASTVTLDPATPLVADVPDETPVLLYPITSELSAIVVVEEGDDAIVARIPRDKEKTVDVGIRDEREQESAEVEFRPNNNEWVVRDIYGQADSTYVGGGARLLDDLEDVDALEGTISDRQHLSFDTASGHWKPYGPVVRHGTDLPADPTQFPWQFFVKHPPRGTQA